MDDHHHQKLLWIKCKSVQTVRLLVLNSFFQEFFPEGITNPFYVIVKWDKNILQNPYWTALIEFSETILSNEKLTNGTVLSVSNPPGMNNLSLPLVKDLLSGKMGEFSAVRLEQFVK